MTNFNYEYSLFMTDDGEVSTGVASGETTNEAAEFLAYVLKTHLKAYFNENPNRIISLVIHTSGEKVNE